MGRSRDAPAGHELHHDQQERMALLTFRRAQRDIPSRRQRRSGRARAPMCTTEQRCRGGCRTMKASLVVVPPRRSRGHRGRR